MADDRLKICYGEKASGCSSTGGGTDRGEPRRAQKGVSESDRVALAVWTGTWCGPVRGRMLEPIPPPL